MEDTLSLMSDWKAELESLGKMVWTWNIKKLKSLFKRVGSWDVWRCRKYGKERMISKTN
jgi:hypothetical protein